MIESESVKWINLTRKELADLNKKIKKLERTLNTPGFNGYVSRPLLIAQLSAMRQYALTLDAQVSLSDISPTTNP